MRHRIGPRLISGVTVCPACLSEVHPHPAGTPGEILGELWLGLATQQILLDLSGTAPSISYTKLDQFKIDVNGRLHHRTKVCPRMPGCDGCEIHGERWRSDDPRLIAWIYHHSSTVSRRQDLAPKDHQSHYLVANLKLSSERSASLHSAVTCTLPDPRPLVDLVPWSRTDSTPLVHRVDIECLATLLARTAGETGAEESRRRIAPTGGNLGSVRLWVLVRDVDGLRRGAYLYDPHTHSLALRGEFDDHALKNALGTRAMLAPCIVLGAGDLAKCIQKYKSFAYRLIHYDAGIALAYAHTVSENIGLTVREYPRFRP